MRWRSEVRTADRPRLAAAGVVQLGRDDDLLLLAGQVSPGRELPTAVREPRAVVELDATVEAVAGVDRPVAARLTGRDAVPVQALADGLDRDLQAVLEHGLAVRAQGLAVADPDLEIVQQLAHRAVGGRHLADVAVDVDGHPLRRTHRETGGGQRQSLRA